MLNPINVKYFKLACPEIGKETNNDIQAKCIICGDSKKNPNKKRLHLYTKNSYQSDMIKCFNCGYTATPYRFFKEQVPYLFEAYKKEIQKEKLTSLKTLSQIKIETKSINELPTQTTQTIQLTFEKPPHFVKAKEIPETYEYLKNRNLTKKQIDLFYTSIEKETELHDRIKDFRHYIILPLLYNNKWYGFYSRDIRHKIFFKYTLNDDYNVYNYFNVNKKDRVYVFEAVFDYMSQNHGNSIVILGSEINKDYLKDFKDIVFCYDNDKTGYKKSLQKIEDGHSVLIYPEWFKEKGYKDLNEALCDGINRETLTTMIDENIYNGILAKIKLKLI